MINAATQSPSPLLVLRGVSREYDTPAGPFSALDDVSLSINAGEFVAGTLACKVLRKAP